MQKRIWSIIGFLYLSFIFCIIRTSADELPPNISHTNPGIKKQGEKISAIVTDDVNIVEVKFYIQDAIMASPQSINMTDPSGDGSYSCNIPENVIIGIARYMLSARSADGKISYHPENARPEGNISNWHSINITDGVPPQIEHTPIDLLKQGGQIFANVTDNTKIEHIYLYFEDAEGNRTEKVEMKLQTGSKSYAANIPSNAFLGEGYYLIEAVDISDNRSVHPLSGIVGNKYTWHKVIISDGTPPEITHSRVSETQAGLPIYANVNDNVTIKEVILHFQNAIGEISEIPMSLSKGKYSAQIPSNAPIGDSRYLISAQDTNENVAFNPDGASIIQPGTWHSVKIVADKTLPVIEHDKLTNIEIGGKVNAIVTDNVGIKSVKIFMSNNQAGPFDSSSMELTIGDRYEGNAPVVEPGNAYYFIEAIDTSDNISKTSVYRVTANDTTKPVIDHDAINVSVENQPIQVRAKVTDNYRVDSVVLHYWSTTIETISLEMQSEPEDQYSALIPAQTASIFYAIVAKDVKGNVAKFPLTAAPGSSGQKIEVKPDLEPPVISHTPEATFEAGTPLSIVAIVTDDVKVDSVSINYTAPDGIELAEKMTQIDRSNQYRWESPAINSVGVARYSIEAVDLAGNKTVSEEFQTEIKDSTNPIIQHIPLNQREAGLPISIEANITDNTQISTSILYYKAVGSVSFKSNKMTFEDSQFSAQIPAQNRLGNLEYYIEAKDAVVPPNVSRSENYTIQIIDTTPPVITHTPPEALQPGEEISTDIIDVIGITSVFLHYQAPDGTESQIVMKKVIGTDNFVANIPSTTTIGKAQYWIEAIDSSDNIAAFPGEHLFNPSITQNIEILPDTTVPQIEHTPLKQIDIGSEIYATVTDNVEVSEVTLFFSYEREPPYTPVSLSLSQIPSRYTGNIPPHISTGTAYYYISAKDSEGNVSYLPANAPDDTSVLYEIQFTDTIPPQIQHEKISAAIGLKPFDVIAKVTDNGVISSVVLHYWTVNNPETEIKTEMESLEQDGSLFYSAEIPGQAIGKMSYYISATDEMGNISYAPQPYGPNSPANISIIRDSEPPVITHTPITQNEAGKPLKVIANVADDVEVSSVEVYYVDVNGENHSAEMQRSGGVEENEFALSMPLQTKIGEFLYHIQAQDSVGNVARIPEEGKYKVQINDTTPPSIDHERVRTGELGEETAITATVTDNAQLDNVILYYKPVGIEEWEDENMNKLDGEKWSISIPAQTKLGMVSYYIEAIDIARTGDSPNIGRLPETGEYQIELVDTTPPNIEHASPGSLEPGYPLTAKITDLSGVSSATLHLQIASELKDLEMSAKQDNPDEYSAILPSELQPGSVTYWFSAFDGIANESKTSKFSLEVLLDNTAPTIEHFPVKTAEAGSEIEIKALAQDNVQIDTISLLYKAVGALSFISVEMTSVEETDEFTGVIPPQKQTGIIEYYLIAKDPKGNPQRHPEQQGSAHEITITDKIPPTIEHDLISNALVGESILISAEVSDNIAVSEVKLYYLPVGEQDYIEKSMELDPKTGSFEATIPAQSEGLLYYYISAKDSKPNTSYMPELAEFGAKQQVNIIVDQSPPEIQHTPISAADAGTVIDAVVIDNFGVRTVEFVYVINGQTRSLDMLPVIEDGIPTDLYTVPIPIDMPIGIIRYQVSAVDENDNSAKFPEVPIEIEITEDQTPPEIEHTPLPWEMAGRPISIAAKVSDFVGVTSVTLFYKGVSASDYAQKEMILEQADGMSYTAEIPPQISAGTVSYYIRARDRINESFLPKDDPTGNPYKIEIEPDSIPPSVLVEAMTKAQPGDFIKATVTDNVDVASVLFFYKDITQADYNEPVPMEQIEEDIFQASIPADVKVGDIFYYIKAFDVNGNESPKIPRRLTIEADTHAPICEHIPPAKEEAGTEITVKAVVTDNVALKRVSLYYYDSLVEDYILEEMTLLQGDEYSAKIPAGEEGILSYYITAEDVNGISATFPENAPETTYEIKIQDTIGPAISHTPQESIPENTPIKLSATIIDPAGVSLAEVQYWNVDSDELNKKSMTEKVKNQYEATLPEQKQMGEFKYRIVAIDGKGISNPSPFYSLIIIDGTPPEIIHTQIDTASQNEPIKFEATISDYSPIESVSLYYKMPEQAEFTEVVMNPTGTPSQYSANIPPPSKVGQLLYRIEAEDSLGNTGHLPADIENPFEVEIIDNMAPTIQHTTVSSVEAGEKKNFTATIADDSGIKNAVLYYRAVGENNFAGFPMESQSPNNFSVQITIGNITGDSYYYIEATDNLGKTAFMPETVEPEQPDTAYVINVKDTQPPDILHTPIASQVDENEDIEIIAERILDNGRIDTVTLHYKNVGTSVDEPFELIEMLQTGVTSQYKINIPKQEELGTFQYFISATDFNGNESFLNNSGTVSNIEDARVNPFKITIVDATSPVITHIPIETASQNKTIEITAIVNDRSENLVVNLFYKMPNQTAFKNINMLSTGNLNEYGANIPGSPEIGKLYYRIEAEDENGNKAIMPTDISTPYEVEIIDDVPPAIAHTNVTIGQVGEMVSFIANVTDDSGVESVTLYFKRVGAKNFESFQMELQPPAEFKTQVSAGTVPGSAYYYIKAEDKVGNQVFFVSEHTTEEPTTGYKINVKDTQPPTISYNQTFTEIDANEDLEIIAKVTDNGQVSDVNIYYKNVGAETTEPFGKIEMESTGTASQYKAQIPKQTQLGELLYFIGAIDEADNEVYLNQEGIKEKYEDAIWTPYRIVIKDVVAPTITHTQSVFQIKSGEPLLITAEVFDSIGVSKVELYYKSENRAFRKVEMEPEDEEDPENNIWKAVVDTWGFFGKFEYYIEATDVAEPEAHTSILPESATDEENPVYLEVEIITPKQFDFKVGNNRFNPDQDENCIIMYNLPKSGDIRVRIFSLAGEEIQDIAGGWSSAGSYQYKWNGFNKENQTVASGIYFVVIEFGGKRYVKRVAVIKRG